jgi:hypothetical protein
MFQGSNNHDLKVIAILRDRRERRKRKEEKKEGDENEGIGEKKRQVGEHNSIIYSCFLSF